MKNQIGETLRHKEDHCPHCGYKVDSVTRMGHVEKPKPGDISICLNCGEFGQFNEQLMLEKAPDEADLLLALSDETRQLVVKARELLKLRGKFR